MQDRPDAAELLEAIQDFMIKGIAPAVKSDEAMAFKTLVSWNMLGIISREIREGETFLNDELTRLALLLNRKLNMPNTYHEKMQLSRELNEDLSRKIRSERLSIKDTEVWEHVRQTTADKLAVANPRYPVD